jgi:site-specific DNA recombinase
MIAAIYARKSTDQHGVAAEARSVTRQVDGARDYAKQRGWAVQDEHVYLDDGISGAEFKNRPGFVRLMNALTPRAPFDVLVVSELSRLGREQLETGYALKQLSQAGVTVYSSLEDREILLDTPTEKFLMSAVNFAAEIEREKARQRTYDALARKAKAGHVTGGRVFGYDNVPVEVTGPDGTHYRSHVDRRVNEEESAVVLRIFALYAQGYGYTSIAKTLNAEGALAPRPQQRRPSGWSPSSIREVLYRPLYRGQLVWNQTQKRNKWGMVEQRPRPRKEWLSVRVDHLQIVSDDQWQAVQRRLAGTRKRSLRSSGGRLLGRPPGEGAKHLLAGLATCSCCGASMEARSRRHGRQRVVFYGCSAYHRKGKSVCANALTLPAAVLEEAVLGAVEDVLLAPGVVEAALDRAAARLVGDSSEDRLSKLKTEIDRLQAELARLVEAVASGVGESAELIAAVQDRTRRRDALQASVEALGRIGSDWTMPGTVRRDLARRLATWKSLLRRHAPQGQQILKKLIDGRLLMTPCRNETPANYRFEGTGTLVGLLAGLVPHKVASPRGFEPVFWTRKG